MSRITAKDEWPKAFYDDGGGSFGQVPAWLLQTGSVAADLNFGGLQIQGSTGQIIVPQSGGAPIVIGSGGISGVSFGGPLVSIIVTAAPVSITTAHSPGDSLGGSSFISTSIAHGLTTAPAMQAQVLDLFAPPSAAAGWRPWNNTNATLTPNDVGIINTGILGSPWYLVPSQGHSDVSFAQNNNGTLDAWYIQAAVTDTTVDVFGAAMSGGTTTAYTTAPRIFIINLYSMLGSNVLDF